MLTAEILLENLPPGLQQAADGLRVAVWCGRGWDGPQKTHKLCGIVGMEPVLPYSPRFPSAADQSLGKARAGRYQHNCLRSCG